jgi:hypothetical protein
MAEPVQFMFTPEEVVQALLKQQGIHEGIWSLGVEFSFTAMTAGPTKEDLFPTAMVGVTKIGLSKANQESSIAFDAAKLNPTEKKVRQRGKK